MAAVGGDCCAPQATAAGVKETEAVSALEKKLKAGPRLSQKETVEMAIATLQVNFCACLWVWRCGGVEERGREGWGGTTYLPAVHAAYSSCRFPLQHVLGEDLKAGDIEVGLASSAGEEGGRFRMLAAAELEEALTAISERD